MQRSGVRSSFGPPESRDKQNCWNWQSKVAGNAGISFLNKLQQHRSTRLMPRKPPAKPVGFFFHAYIGVKVLTLDWNPVGGRKSARAAIEGGEDVRPVLHRLLSLDVWITRMAASTEAEQVLPTLSGNSLTRKPDVQNLT